MPRSAPADLSAATLAEACLGYLAEHPDELLAFMQQAGLDPDALRQTVGTPALERGLIDYFASNEPILLAFCANAGLSPEQFMRVWQRQNPSG
ncbi:MAG TPA: DUF3572 family protein [Devosia sp.]|uniref:DUF3572 family protein n=1 Tax=Devosia sp. TaxID=1871048 RepID=UPI002F94E7B3